MKRFGKPLKKSYLLREKPGVKIESIDNNDILSIASANKHFICTVNRLRAAAWASVISIAHMIGNGALTSSRA